MVDFVLVARRLFALVNSVVDHDRLLAAYFRYALDFLEEGWVLFYLVRWWAGQFKFPLLKHFGRGRDSFGT
jgi:hypothetical protein